MPLLILFVLIPLAEVYAFMAVGDEIGVLKTLLLCVLTAIIGGLLVRQQGMQTLMNAQNAMQGGNLPLNNIFDGICIVIAGALLLTPGFVTDIVGFSLLFPPFRQFLRHIAAKSGKFSMNSTNFGQSTRHSRTSSNDDVIEGVYKDVSNDHDRLDK